MKTSVLRVLVADDELTTRLVLKAALEQSGFSVVLAEDGEDALRQFAAEPCDMVMLDVEMPGLSGYQVCRKLRQSVGGELPIVMVTGMDDLQSVEQAFNAGATDFIPKPIHLGLIGHRVRYLLRSCEVLSDLHAANARNSAILNAMPDILLHLDAQGRVLDAHFGCHCPVGYACPNPGKELVDCFPAEIARLILEQVRYALDSGEIGTVDYALALPDGQAAYYEARLVAVNDGQCLCLIRDVTSRKQAEANAHRLAVFDTLTGLPNRPSFARCLEREIQRARYQDVRLAVFFLDLDSFKTINDSLGHTLGDQLLQQVAVRLKKEMLPADPATRNSADSAQDVDVELARLGGDEFAILAPRRAALQDTIDMGLRVQELMRRPFELDGRKIALSASIGIALFPEDGGNAETLLKHADTAMYHAKDLGRDNFQFYSSSLTAEAIGRLNMKSDLQQALERNELFLVYQPQIELPGGRVASVEALIRWKHPQRGLVSPAEFIPAAEENGMIVPVGEWVLRQACADAARWQAAGTPLCVAVNLSPVQFRNPELLALVRQVLAETGLPAHLLDLEITEGALVADTAETMSLLKALRELGCLLSLDDFGTGYSSLNYLKHLPLSRLKIDQSFVRDLHESRENLAIVRVIITLAKNLGFGVIAEGVETLTQARLLQDMACEVLQGYYFGRPVDFSEIAALLDRRWDLAADACS